MTAVELLNFSADKFSFSPFLAVVALANVIRAPVNVFCNAGVDVRLLSLYNCCIKPETEENPEIFLFWLSSSSNPSNLDHFVPLMKESFVSQRSEGSLSRPVLDDTDTWTGIFSQIGLKRAEEWLLESRVHTGKKAKIGGKKPSGSKLPKTNINMPGPSSILSGCGKTKSQPIDCARSISFPAGGILGKKTLLKQSKISSIFNYLPVSEGKDDDHCDNVSVSKQECIVDPSSQVSDSSIKQESVIEVQTPNLVMEPVTCSLDIMNDLDDFARYIENGSKISASEKSNVIAKKWIPEDFVFSKDHNKLCFKPLWCKTYKWLAYSKSCNGVYCVTCVLFGKEISQLNVAKLSAFYKEPFYDWKHGIQRFKRHASSAIHKNADVDLMHFKNIKIYHKDVPINQQLNKLKK